MKTFKRILAIVLVVMMVVPMMTTGLTVSAATAETLEGQFSAGVTFAGGNWKAYSYNDWSAHMGEALAAFDDLAKYTVDAEGQICLYNSVQNNFNSYQGYGWVNQNVINVLQSTNTTAIDGFFFRNGMMSQAPLNGSTVYSESLSYAFSENQLLGTLSPDVYTKAEGFAVEDGMVTDGLVISMHNTDNDITSNGSVFNVITAYVMDGGKIISSQSFETESFGKDFGLCVGHAHNTYISFVDGILTFHVEDNYSADGTYFNQTYTFDELETSTISTYKDYYFCVGSKGEGADGIDGSVNINLARIGTFTIDATTGLYSTADSENKNIADWTGHGTVSCAHEEWSDWTETLAPSCTTTGIQERVCQSCGKVEQGTIAANGHSYSDWTVDLDPDCTNAGSKSRVCSVCGDVDTEVIPANGHSWSDWYNTLDPNCTDDGMEQRDCNVCGSYEENILPALGHAWAWDVLPTFEVNGQRTCPVCGEVEEDLVYDAEYYWTFASDNKVSNIDAGYADFNDDYEKVIGEDGSIELQDMSLKHIGEYSYYPVLKATSQFKTDLEGFSVTVEPVTSEDLTIPYQYPTTLSFLWTNYDYNYDDANEYSVYNPASVGMGTKLAASRYGHIYNNYLAGEYTLCVVLADTSQIYSPNDYGTPNDGVYDWMYTTVVSNGNYWTTKMDAISVDATAPITLSLYYEFDPTDVSRSTVAFIDLNGELYAPSVGADHQLATQSYYFSVAAYGEGVNQHTASFKITDICGEAPATFAGFAHECTTEHFDIAATCGEDGTSYDICLSCKAITNEVITPATGNHTWNDATCTDPKTCSVCGATEGDALGHSYDNFYCTVCGDAEGVAVINDTTVYATLADALNKAVDGDTVKLLEGVSGKDTYKITNDINLDLNGKTLRHTSGNTVIVDGATVNIIGTKGTIRSSDGISVTVQNGGIFNINTEITVRCSSEEGFNVFAIDDTSAVNINVEGCRFYKDPTAAGATLAKYLEVQMNSGTNYSIIKVFKEVTATADGNVISVTGIDETVKDILVGFGEWSTYAEAKAAKVFQLPGNSPRVVDGAWNYKVAENGIYTVVIRYFDGSMETKVIHVECNDGTEPNIAIDGNTVTLSNLNDLLVLRYVKGEYETSAEIKRAEGVVNVPYYSKRIVDNSYSVTLDYGTYTFVTQFKDGNFVYYTVVIEAPVVKDYKITFDPDGGEMPEGVELEYGINYQENYKEATGIEYPVPTLEGYVFGGWYWEAFNYNLSEGDWNGGYFAVQQDVPLIALWLEA